MIRSSYLGGVILVAVSVTAWAALPGGGTTSAPGAGAPQGGRQSRANQAPAGLGQAMGAMERELRVIKADAADPTKQEAVIRNIDLMIRDSATSKLGVPGAIRRMPAAQQAAATASYHAMMLETIKALVSLEEAVVEKKAEEIKKCIGQLDELEKKGHAEFLPAGR